MHKIPFDRRTNKKIVKNSKTDQILSNLNMKLMKKFKLSGLLLVSCILLSCQPKKEIKEPIIYQNNQKIKYDDEPVKGKTNDSISEKSISTKKK